MQEWAQGAAAQSLGSAQGGASGQGSGQAGAEPGSVLQDSDLKQYLDHCGNLMSMHNVKVRASRRATYPPARRLGTRLFPSLGTHSGQLGPSR